MTTTRRRARGITAKAIVLGEPATPILHEGRTAHLAPVRSGDHRARYTPGMRLAIKQMVPGPTACHVTVTSVRGPRDEFTLGQLAYLDARALGHTRLDHLWRRWITNHDQAWLGRAIDAGTDTDDEIARRFETRWSGKLAWLIRFQLDRTAAPRLLADETGSSDQFKLDRDGRWIYSPRQDERESDRGYTSSDSRALAGELPALTDSEWERHIRPAAEARRTERLAAAFAGRAALGHEQRLADAKAKARSKGYDIRDEVRRYEHLARNGQHDKALRQLEILETRVFPIAAAA